MRKTERSPPMRPHQASRRQAVSAESSHRLTILRHRSLGLIEDLSAVLGRSGVKAILASSRCLSFAVVRSELIDFSGRVGGGDDEQSRQPHALAHVIRSLCKLGDRR